MHNSGTCSSPSYFSPWSVQRRCERAERKYSTFSSRSAEDYGWGRGAGWKSLPYPPALCSVPALSCCPPCLGAQQAHSKAAAFKGHLCRCATNSGLPAATTAAAAGVSSPGREQRMQLGQGTRCEQLCSQHWHSAGRCRNGSTGGDPRSAAAAATATAAAVSTATSSQVASRQHQQQRPQHQ